MKRLFRLARNEDYQRVRRQGRSWSTLLLVLQVQRNELPYSRFGLVVGKRVGKAVMRNRVKRLLRESVRLRFDAIKPGWDIVLIARGPAAEASFWVVGGALDSLLKRADLMAAIPAPDSSRALAGGRPPPGAEIRSGSAKPAEAAQSTGK